MLSLVKLSALNLVRRPLRSAVTACGVGVATASLFCLLAFHRGYQVGLSGELDRLGANLLVVPKGCPYDAASIALHGANWPCYLKSVYLAEVRRTPHVAVGAPVFMNALYDAATGGQTVYCGVEPDIVRLKRMWRISGRFPVSGEVLAGAEAARKNGWRLGEAVQLPGLQGRRARVSGILGSVQGADDLFLFLPLGDAQAIFRKPGQLTHILVRLDDPSHLESVTAALRGCEAGMDMNIVPLAHLFRSIESLIRSTRLLLGCVVLTALLAAGAGVGNTLLMAVMERTREIGVLRAVGASQWDVLRIVWLEALALSGLGGVLGVAGAAVSARFVEAWLRARLPFSPNGTLVSPEISTAALCVVGALVLGAVSGSLPAWRAGRCAPVDAMRAGSAGL
jgi:putative ABC transport system permease protein